MALKFRLLIYIQSSNRPIWFEMTKFEKKKALASYRKCFLKKVGHLGLEPRTSRL